MCLWPTGLVPTGLVIFRLCQGEYYTVVYCNFIFWFEHHVLQKHKSYHCPTTQCKWAHYYNHVY